MNKMVERVAKAIVRSYLKSEVPNALEEDIDEAVNKCYHEWIIHAKDAIEAMRELTQEMLDVSVRIGVDCGMGVNYNHYDEVYRAMIDKALE